MYHYRSCCFAIQDFLAFSWSDWRHKCCVAIWDRLFWLSDMPPFAKGTLSIESQCKNYWKLSKSCKSSWNHPFFWMQCSHACTFDQQVTLYFAKNRKLKFLPLGICECCPLFHYRGWGKHSDRIGPDHENVTVLIRPFFSSRLWIQNTLLKVVSMESIAPWCCVTASTAP